MAKKKQTASGQDALTVVEVAVDQLDLDTENPRIRGGLEPGASQLDIVRHLWKNMAVDELAYSIAYNGFQRYEPLLVAQEGKRLVVIEGNRRLAAVRILRSKSLQNELHVEDLPTLTPEVTASIATLPVEIVGRKQVWQYIGFKHVNGPQTWQSYAKAQYIARVHEEMRVSLNDIARRIGDRNATVERLYRGLTVLRQAEKAKIFTLDQRSKRHFAFSHLYTGLDYPGFQAFLGLNPNAAPSREPIKRSKLPHLRELCVWLYGDTKEEIEPLVQRQNPDLKILDDVLQSEAGLVALRRQLPLIAARQASLGDAQLFRQSLQSAKDALVSARGYSLHGYRGEKSLRDQAEEVSELASALFDDLVRAKKPAAKRKS
jgi:hypothetical protein